MIKTLVSQNNSCKTEAMLEMVGSYNCLKKNTKTNKFKNILKNKKKIKIRQKVEINRQHKKGKIKRTQEETLRKRRKRRRIRNDICKCN